MSLSESGHKTTVLLHRYLLNEPKGKVIDHLDGDSLNNKRDNLRICTQKENIQNQICKQKNISSKYRGVYFAKNINKWRSQIRFNNKLRHLGCFNDEIKAAKEYDKNARSIYGVYAKLNFERG
jgi:hypothetical protein